MLPVILIIIMLLIVLPICFFIDQAIKGKDKKKDHVEQELKAIKLEIEKEKLKKIRDNN